jgi:hypothetical protein
MYFNIGGYKTGPSSSADTITSNKNYLNIS